MSHTLKHQGHLEKFCQLQLQNVEQTVGLQADVGLFYRNDLECFSLEGSLKLFCAM